MIRVQPARWPCQGLAVLPLFAGFDLAAAEPDLPRGRFYSYDLTGGRYEETDLPLRRLRIAVRPRLAEEAATAPDLEAEGCRHRGSSRLCYDAADDDSATGGPDTVTRRIFPVVGLIDRRRVPPADRQAEVAEIAEAVSWPGAAMRTTGEARRGAAQAAST